ncbi:MAG: tRNA pseudouridine(55) synthase TruB [Solirubrobacterales bacterium]|nr:tRNA pseudouridine(55) synthase TruB [Solirubrobacterales bacterium]
MADADGVLLVDKPAGKSSHDVVAGVRRTLGRGIKGGHAGTLDPFATGLLLILVGRATRAQRYLMALPKSYEVTARLGWRSSTGDPEGEVERGKEPPEPPILPVGRLQQRPPAYSAVKVGGVRAYAAARRGEPLEIAEREVEVMRFERRWREGDRAGFVVECSSGTYVRVLIAELGDAYCLELRRTRIGRFDVADADPQHPLRLEHALDHLPERHLSGEDAKRAGHGTAVPGEAVGTVRLMDERGLIALAEPLENGTLKPVVGFRG